MRNEYNFFTNYYYFLKIVLLINLKFDYVDPLWDLSHIFYKCRVFLCSCPNICVVLTSNIVCVRERKVHLLNLLKKISY